MTAIDHKKLSRLRLDLTERHAALSGLTDRYQQARDGLQYLILNFRVSRHAEVHWRTGDDTQVFLSLSAAEQAKHRGEVDRANEIALQRVEMVALQGRIEALRPAVDALQRLINACDKYTKEV